MMMQETLKMAFAMLMTAVLACTGTYAIMEGHSEEGGHNTLATVFPVLDLGGYVANDIMDGTSPANDKELARFGSFEELTEFRERYASAYSYYYYDMFGGEEAGVADGATSFTSSFVAPAANYQTNTNIQVAGVDEGDIVKNDGKYAYVISESGGSALIIRAYPAEDACILSEIECAGYLMDLYVFEDTLVLLEQVYYFEGGFQRSSYMYSETPFVNVKVFDITNRSAPALVNTAAVAGTHLTSRMIDGTLYLMGSQNLLPWENESQLPVPLDTLYYIDTGEEGYAITTFLTLDVMEPAALPNLMGIVMANSANIYVSTDNIYITHHEWLQSDNAFSIAGGMGGDMTIIHRIQINGHELKYKARGEVQGSVLNRYSMDQYDGHFRIATTKSMFSSQQSKNMVHVLGMDLEETGMLDNIAPGESIYSARFMGPRCYLVTFRQVDPFFVIDMHDAENPKILGELKIPGYSSYLHPYDENHIIGLGKDGSLVKVALFNVTDVENPTELDSFTVGYSYSDSIALYEPHAFMFSREKNLLVIPVTGYDYNTGESSSGANVFEISPENGIEKAGVINHENADWPDYGYYSYYYQFNQVKRSFIINDVLYTVSGRMMKANAIDGLGELSAVEWA